MFGVANEELYIEDLHLDDGTILQDGQIPKSSNWFIRESQDNKNNSLSLDHHTKILASLVPDEIIYNCEDRSIREFESVLLLGDVSGFTDLCGKYNKTGKGGPSRLTEVLNTYIGSMVQEILSLKGDVLKFSGDAFLAVWKSESCNSIQDTVNKALDCAITIQKSYGRYETDIGVILKVKLAISAGQVFFSIIGSDEIKHYVIAGKPIWEVKFAEYLCSSGDVLVSQSAWQYVNIHEYDYIPMPDGHHVKVSGMGQSWRNIQKIQIQNQENNEVNIEDDFVPLMYGDRVPDPEGGPVLMGMTGEEIDANESSSTDEFSLRPSINFAAEHNMKDALCPYIIRPVMKGVDMDEPLEYLTEMRQVVIVFINLITTQPEVEKLIPLVDKSYRIVCSVVDDAQGCVNKVSLFDKDLMFLVIFGLRGYKHDLESQIALRCAADLRPELLAMDEVIDSSVAVTTGMTYCGVVGHTMRREYTVIGVSVNKAARLMVAYPGRVTCDKETFLHSKLEACHFILQEPRVLKGLTSIGPIYEFKEKTVTEARTHTVCKFPLLGREKELDFFQSLLNDKVNQMKEHKQRLRNVYSALIITGEPRQGKSRLLDEIVCSVGQEIMINKISLTSRDYKVPYLGIQLICGPALGLTDISSPKEKEEKILANIGTMKTPLYLCSLNTIFHVNFELNQTFLSLNDEQQNLAMIKKLKKLLHGCFKQTWVIVMDDCEFLDEDTWKIFPKLLEVYNIFFVMTMGSHRKLSYAAEVVINHDCVYHLTLAGIHKWYHAGLACQMLDVAAIPPELEKVIQSRSNGNPGWVESYLVSLIQAEGLVISTMLTSKVEQMGLMRPPVSMLMRTGRTIGLDYDSRFDKEMENRQDDWKMYATSYRESYLSMLVGLNEEEHKEKLKAVYSNKILAVCTLSPDFVLDEVGAELTMDVMMLKMFDSLTSYEQLLLKYSSVLGESFPRHMLMALMGQPIEREVCLAVKKLFEIHILGCANGNFTRTSSMIYRQRLVNPNLDRGVLCECQGLVISESCKDLPVYASCGYLRFRMTLFRDTTYNLLTDNQKKDFHSRAIKYLERETRRCNSCGNGHFTCILGYRYEEVSRTSARSQRSTPLHQQFDFTISSTKIRNNISFNTEDNSVTMDESLQNQIDLEEMLHAKLRDSTSGDQILTEPTRLVMGSMSARKHRRRTCKLLPVPGVNTLKSSLSLTRSFSSIDFTSCECPLILTTMYTQLLEHCRGTGLQDQIMDALLEYAAVCITLCNLPQAMRLLDDAQLQLTVKPKEEENAISPWKIPYILGKIYTLLGYSRLELGQIEDTYKILFLAMKELGYPFPTNKLNVYMATKWQMFKQKLMIDMVPQLLIGRVTGFEALYSKQMSECLALICTMFKYTQKWKLARLAAIWGLNKALESDMDFNGLCTAYTNMMDVADHYGSVHISWHLENSALEVCSRKVIALESQELQAVGRLYVAVFHSRLLRSEIERGISVGFKTLHICTSIHATHLKLQLLPQLIESLLLRSRISEAVSLIQDLNFTSGEDSDKSARTWYYALCMEIQLYTGYSVIPFKKCKQFYLEEGGSMITIRDPDAKRRYFTCMWLWCVRNKDWEAATMWDPRAHVEFELFLNDSLDNKITAMSLLEGLLLCTVEKMNHHNIKATGTYIEITTLINQIKKATKVAKIIIPRFLLLKAYYRQIRYHDSKALRKLQEAKNLAQKQGNLLISTWAEHNEKVWKGTISPILREYWREHCCNGLLDWHEADMSPGKMVMFSLPVPRYS